MELRAGIGGDEELRDSQALLGSELFKGTPHLLDSWERGRGRQRDQNGRRKKRERRRKRRKEKEEEGEGEEGIRILNRDPFHNCSPWSL